MARPIGFKKRPRRKKQYSPEQLEKLRAQMLYARSFAPKAPNVVRAAALKLPQDKIDQAVGQLVTAAPHLAQGRYRHACGLLARVVARIALMDEQMAKNPRAWLFKMTQGGRVHMGGGEIAYMRWIDTARRLLNDLGLTPAAVRFLGLDVLSPDAKALPSLQEFLQQAASDGPVPESGDNGHEE